MPVTLTKIVNGKAALSDAHKNEETVRCPRCERMYQLIYSDDERHWVKNWLKLAETAIRTDHDSRHEAPTIPLDWRLQFAPNSARARLAKANQKHRRQAPRDGAKAGNPA
jgi:hypothetical protein